jgi:hypothetical protein
MSKRLTGLNPLAYMGVEPSMPPNMYMSPESPTPNDVQNFNLGDFWVDTTTQQLWVLVSQQRGVATWITLFGGSADSFVTDSGTATPSGGILNVNGDGLNILTSGSGNTITIRENPDPVFGNVTIEDSLTLPFLTGGVLVSNGSGDISEVATTNHSLLIGNATGTISNLGVATNGQIPIGSTGANPVLATITAGSGISVTNSAGGISIAATGAELTVDGNSGSATPAAGILNIVGSGGLSTTASGNTVTISGAGVPRMTRIVLTSAQIKLLATNPITVIAAQGANTAINILSVFSFFSYGGNNAFTAASGGTNPNIWLFYNINSTNVFTSFNFATTASGTGQYTSTASNYTFINSTQGSRISTADTVNTPIIVGITSDNSTQIGGNAAGDNTITLQVTYEVVSVPL